MLDVKCGSGALMKSLNDSLGLARAMVDIGQRNNRRMSALITRMDEPLGSHVGNALEVKEAIDVLAGKTKGPLLEVAKALGAEMLMLAGLCENAEQAEQRLSEAVENGAGLQKLAEMIGAQGGDARVCEDTSLLPQARFVEPVLAPESGFLAAMDTELAGQAAQLLGAGRRHKDDIIDPAVGYIMNKRLGDRVEQGEIIAQMHFNDRGLQKEAVSMLLRSLSLSPVKTPFAPWILARIGQDGKEVSLP